MSTSVGHYIDFGLVEFLFPLNVTLLRLSDPTNYIQSFIWQNIILSYDYKKKL